MSLEDALERNTAALARLADLIERNAEFIRGIQPPPNIAAWAQMPGDDPYNPNKRYAATCEGSEVLDSMPVASSVGDSRDAAAETKLAVAVEKAATEPAEVTADSMVFAPGEDIPEFTWEGVTKQFRKYAQKHGRDGAVKLAEEFGLTIPLNKDALTPDRYEDFYHACSN